MLLCAIATAPGAMAGTPEAGPSARAVRASLEDGGSRNWEVVGMSSGLNLRERPSASARIVTRYASGALIDNRAWQRPDIPVWSDVQQLGSAMRGDASAKYLKPAISPDCSAATGPGDSAPRAGQGKFEANGNMFCVRVLGQPMTQCEFGIARAGGGYTTVLMTKPHRRTRAIFLRMGKAIGADASESERNFGKFSAADEDDRNLSWVDSERDEIAGAVGSRARL